MTATVPQVLRDAAELIERERDAWVRPGPIPLVLSYVCDGLASDAGPTYTAARSALGDYIGAGGPGWWGVRDWEDVTGRTATEVLAALRGAADAWEAEHGN